MGAVTVTRTLDQPRRITRRLAVLTGTVTMSNSYSTGGDTGFDPANVPSAQYLQVSFGNSAVGTAPTFSADMTNKKVIARGTAGAAGGLTEIAGGVNLSAHTFPYTAIIKLP